MRTIQRETERYEKDTTRKRNTRERYKDTKREPVQSCGVPYMLSLGKKHAFIQPPMQATGTGASMLTTITTTPTQPKKNRHEQSLPPLIPYLHGRSMLAIRPVGRLMRKSRHLQAFRLLRKITTRFQLLYRPTPPMQIKYPAVLSTVLAQEDAVLYPPLPNSLCHVLQTTGTACISKSSYGCVENVPVQRLETKPLITSAIVIATRSHKKQKTPLYLVTEHAYELLHPSRDGLRHPLREVGTLGADDKLLVGAVLVHVVDRAAQNLRATERKRDG